MMKKRKKLYGVYISFLATKELKMALGDIAVLYSTSEAQVLRDLIHDKAQEHGIIPPLPKRKVDQ